MHSVLPALSAFILKNGQMPLLKRINTASGVSLCQEKMRSAKRQPMGTTSAIVPFPNLGDSKFFGNPRRGTPRLYTNSYFFRSL
jgi:hypothetical protein